MEDDDGGGFPDGDIPAPLNQLELVSTWSSLYSPLSKHRAGRQGMRQGMTAFTLHSQHQLPLPSYIV